MLIPQTCIVYMYVEFSKFYRQDTNSCKSDKLELGHVYDLPGISKSYRQDVTFPYSTNHLVIYYIFVVFIKKFSKSYRQHM